MALIKGIPVVLYQRTAAGRDQANAALYTETPVTVENVLVTPVGAAAVTTPLQLEGRRAAYELCIPKGDKHSWEGCTVEFFGQKWRVVGSVTQYIDALVPLCWNKKVQVERYE